MSGAIEVSAGDFSDENWLRYVGEDGDWDWSSQGCPLLKVAVLAGLTRRSAEIVSLGSAEAGLFRCRRGFSVVGEGPSLLVVGQLCADSFPGPW